MWSNHSFAAWRWVCDKRLLGLQRVVDDDEVGAAARSAGEIMRRSENVDPAEGMKGEEVGVARDNQLRGAIDGQLEKLVVLRVAAGTHDMGDRDSFGNTVEQPQEFAAFFDRYVGIELRTGENIRPAP